MPNTASKRPKHLPDFCHPPLQEVALGVQFATPAGYQQILAKDVWELYRNDYPRVQEQAALPPSFETFGLPSVGANFSFVTGATHDRFWFLRQDGDELIQFQNDRLLHNWRKVAEKDSEYPRFEYMVSKFEEEVRQLQDYMSSISPQSLIINQCEVSYVNHIACSNEEELAPSNWLRFLNFSVPAEDFRVGFREVIRDEKGAPQGRLVCDCGIALDSTGKRVISLTLSAKGAPKEPNIESALNFILIGRDLIVRRFTELTTDSAHNKWGRCK